TLEKLAEHEDAQIAARAKAALRQVGGGGAFWRLGEGSDPGTWVTKRILSDVAGATASLAMRVGKARPTPPTKSGAAMAERIG
ncbi:MAG: hypothetical protein O7D91_03520, partial [Planctomycetota bacterium]|nr:hypothetical protein [Planctomycetota bacterium]